MEDANPIKGNRGRPKRKRKGIPLPSFDRICEEETATQTCRRQVLEYSFVDQKPLSKDNASGTSSSQSNNWQQPIPGPRQSRIAGVLSYQRFQQQLDPSMPRHYTRKENKIMNDETPERGEEESPINHNSTLTEKTLEAGLSPQSLFDSEEYTSYYATQRFTDSEKPDKPLLLKCPTTERGNEASNTSRTGQVESTSSGPASKSMMQKESDWECLQANSQNHVENANAQTRMGASSSTTIDQASKLTSTKPPPKVSSFRLFFVQRGRDMHEEILVGPKANARARGATVLDHFDPHATDPLKLPTHFIVGAVSSPEVVVRTLGFESVLQMRYFLYQHNIQCATKAWATKISNEPYQAPRSAVILRQQRVPYPEIYAPITPLPPPRISTKNDSNERNKKHGTRSKNVRTSKPKRNVALSKLFKTISKAYQAAPLDPIDTWRAYTFATASSRLQALPFEINSEESLRRVKTLKGFGSSIMAIIREFVESNFDRDEDANTEEGSQQITCQRLQDVTTNPQRRSLKTFMNIWGVGRTKALEFVQAGYTNIDEIKHDFDQHRLRVTLQRNQYIGLICYDDIMEEMDRAEVERIGDIVKRAIRDYYSQVEVQIMGSYRRGKETCGDVDILMVHPRFHHKIQPCGLGRIIDNLRKQGHVAYHLTQLAGMDMDAYETLPHEVAKSLDRPISLRPKRDKETCSSYMGVFYSPVHPGRKRRVDIKFYPYRERVFASLYFTGNTWFNRS